MFGTVNYSRYTVLFFSHKVYDRDVHRCSKVPVPGYPRCFFKKPRGFNDTSTPGKCPSSRITPPVFSTRTVGEKVDRIFARMANDRGGPHGEEYIYTR